MVIYIYKKQELKKEVNKICDWVYNVTFSHDLDTSWLVPVPCLAPLAETVSLQSAIEFETFSAHGQYAPLNIKPHNRENILDGFKLP